MAGYNGYSMSNNAVSAYEDGEKPLSKWTKFSIIETIENAEISIPEEKMQTLKNLKVAQLKTLLYNSSWHHTSNHYNKTEFYAIDFDKINKMSIDELKNIIVIKATKEAKEEPTKTTRKVSYVVWEGNYRNYKKPVTYIEECEVIGNWAFTKNGKKSILAKGFEFLD
jgi:hypothetical protein